MSERATNLVDSAAVTCLRAELYTTSDQSDRAVEVCLDYLRRIGVDWSPHPTKDEVRREYSADLATARRTGDRELVDLPLMTDSDCRATLDVLIGVCDASLVQPTKIYTTLSAADMANLSLEHGNSDGSCHAYAPAWHDRRGSNFGDYQAGFRFGKLAVDLVEKTRTATVLKPASTTPLAITIIPWTRHLHDGRDLVRRAFDAAKEIGDLTYAAYQLLVT